VTRVLGGPIERSVRSTNGLGSGEATDEPAFGSSMKADTKTTILLPRRTVEDTN
jgi:hypothetical protein